jgi:hypothetical protein
MPKMAQRRSMSDPQQVLPPAKVALEAHALGYLKRGDDAACSILLAHGSIQTGANTLRNTIVPKQRLRQLKGSPVRMARRGERLLRWTRERLIEELRNHLQNVGLVSDEAVTIDDRADRDLLRAHQAAS